MQTSLRRLARQAKSSLGLRRKAAHFRRHISSQDAERLASELSALLERPFTETWVQDKAQLIRNVESKMIGRIAGDIEDYILNYAVRFVGASRDKSVPRLHAEIGTLFGGSLILSLMALREAESADRVLAIDPFFGYYGQDVDIITRLAVTANSVWRNVDRFGFARNLVEIVSEVSQSDLAIAAARRAPLGSLFIDGDHSYQGVESDWVNYYETLAPGGYVLIDNFNDPAWPEIDQFIAEKLTNMPEGWIRAGFLNHSLLLKRLQEGESAARAA